MPLPGEEPIPVHNTMPAQLKVRQNTRTRKVLFCRAAILFAAIVASGTLFAAGLQPTAQTLEVQTTSTTVHKPARPHKRSSKARPAASPAQAAPVPAAPAAPKLPDWPVNERPNEATVVWNSQGLSIEASNSSLGQILKDVSATTGAKVEGLSSDERVFGSYGPGKARDVLSQLLNGSGYNVLMIGDQGQGTPREIVLSAAPKGPAPPAANNQNATSDENADAAEDQPQPQPQPQVPPSIRNGFNPGMPPRTPQQIMQEMQQRQQQIMEMQQRNNPQ
jgi:hypothetical protein